MCSVLSAARSTAAAATIAFLARGDPREQQSAWTRAIEERFDPRWYTRGRVRECRSGREADAVQCARRKG